MLQPGQPDVSVSIDRAAHFQRRLETEADSGTIGMAKDLAEVVAGKLGAAHTGRFAVRHARNRRRNGGYDTARATARTTVRH